MAQLSPSLPISPEDIHNGMRTVPEARGSWTTTRVSTRPRGKVHRTRNSSCFALRWTTLHDGNGDERCVKATVGVPSALIFEQRGRHRCLSNKFRYPIFHHNLRQFCNLLYLNGFTPRQIMGRSRQFLDGFNSVTRIRDVLLLAAACRTARNTHCCGTCSRMC